MQRGSGTYAGSYAERVELGNRVQDALEQFTDKVRRRLRGVLVILFGSYADGTADEESDLDLLVIASGFEKMDLWERMTLLGRARVGMYKPMEILGVTPAEAESPDAGSFIRDEVLDKGLVAG